MIRRMKAATALRSFASNHNTVDEDMVLFELDLSRGENVEGFTSESVSGLAELIDPTRTMEYVGEFMSWHCLGCDMMAMMPKSDKPSYCPHCGARVVDE